MTESEENVYAIYRSITDDEIDDQDIFMEWASRAIENREVSVDTLRTARVFDINSPAGMDLSRPPGDLSMRERNLLAAERDLLWAGGDIWVGEVDFLGGRGATSRPVWVKEWIRFRSDGPDGGPGSGSR